MNEQPVIPLLTHILFLKPRLICKNWLLILLGLGFLGFYLSLSPASLANTSKNENVLTCLDERYGFYIWITVVRRGENSKKPFTEEQRTQPCGHRRDHPNPWWLWGDTIDDAYLFSLAPRGTLKGSTLLTATFQVRFPGQPIGSGFITATVAMEDAIFPHATVNLTSTVKITDTRQYTNVLELTNVFTDVYKLNPNLAKITVTVVLTELLKINDPKIIFTQLNDQGKRENKTRLYLHDNIALNPNPFNPKQVNPKNVDPSKAVVMILDFKRLLNGLPEARFYLNTREFKDGNKWYLTDGKMGGTKIDYTLEGQELKVKSTSGFPYFTLRISSTSGFSETFLNQNNKLCPLSALKNEPCPVDYKLKGIIPYTTPWLVSTTTTSNAIAPNCLLPTTPWLASNCKANYNLRFQIDGARLGGTYYVKGTFIDGLPDWLGQVGGDTPGIPDWDNLVMVKEQDPKPTWAYPRVGIFQRQKDGPLWRIMGDEYDSEHELLMPTFPHLDFGLGKVDEDSPLVEYGGEIDWFKINPRPLYFNMLTSNFEQQLFVGFQNAGNFYYNALQLPPKADFESPFAFYSFDPDPDPATRSRYTQLLIRSSPFAAGNNFVVDNKFVFDASIPRISFRYSWKTQAKSFLWNYSLDVSGHRAYTEEIKIGDIMVYGVKPPDYPRWVTSKEWPLATFVEARDGYGGSEGIYFQSAQAIHNWTYLDGVDDEEPYYFAEPYMIKVPALVPVADIAVPEGFRAENNAQFYRKPEMYYSPIDRKLHLLTARHGLWNLKNEVVLREHNLDEGNYLNGWTRERITLPKGYADEHGEPDYSEWHRARRSPAEESLYTLEDNFIYIGYPASEVRAAVYDPALFNLTPPTDKATWKSFADQMRNFPNPQKPYFETVPQTKTLACALKNVRFRNQHSYTEGQKRFIIGEITNDTEEKAYLTRLTARFYSATGELATTVSQTTTAIFLAELAPHERLPFKLELNDPSVTPACFELSLAMIRIKSQQNYRDREGKYYIVGEIINESNESIYFPKVKVDLYDANNQLLASITQQDADILVRRAEPRLDPDPEAKDSPLQLVPFKVVIPNPPATLATYKLSLTWDKSNKNAHYRLVKPLVETKDRYNKGIEIFGEMQNDLTEKMKDLRLAVTFYDKEETVKETGVLNYPNEIAPNETFTYTLNGLRKDLDLKKLHYVVRGEGDLITNTHETEPEAAPEPFYSVCLARDPCDLQAWMTNFPSKLLISTTGMISNVRKTKQGFRFLVDLQPGYYLENIRNASDLQLAKDLQPGTYVVEYTKEGFFTIEEFKLSTVWATIPYTNITINQYNPEFIKLIVQNKGLEDILGASVEISATNPEGKSGWITRTVDLLAGKMITVTLQWPSPQASLMWPPPDADTWKKIKRWIINSTGVWKVTPQVYSRGGGRLRFATSTVTVKPGPDAGSITMIQATSSPLTRPLMFFVLVVYVGVAFSVFWLQWEMPLESTEANKAVEAIDSGDEAAISMLYDSLKYDSISELSPITQAKRPEL